MYHVSQSFSGDLNFYIFPFSSNHSFCYPPLCTRRAGRTTKRPEQSCTVELYSRAVFFSSHRREPRSLVLTIDTILYMNVNKTLIFIKSVTAQIFSHHKRYHQCWALAPPHHWRELYKVAHVAAAIM